MKGEAKAKVSEPGGQERVTDENGDFGGRYRASEAERYSRKSGVNVPDSTAMRVSCSVASDARVGCAGTSRVAPRLFRSGRVRALTFCVFLLFPKNGSLFAV